MSERQLTLPFMTGETVFKVAIVDGHPKLLKGTTADIDGAPVVKCAGFIFTDAERWHIDVDSAFRCTLEKFQADNTAIVQRLLDARRQAQAG